LTLVQLVPETLPVVLLTLATAVRILRRYDDQFLRIARRPGRYPSGLGTAH